MPYAPGESGNPAGRPRGARGRAAVLRESIDAEIPEIIQSLIRQAKDGDVAACRLLLERCLPPVRASGPSVETDLPDFETGDLKTRSEAVIAAMGRGDIADRIGATEMLEPVSPARRAMQAVGAGGVEPVTGFQVVGDKDELRVVAVGERGLASQNKPGCSFAHMVAEAG